MLGVLLAIVALILLGLFWRLVVRGAVVAALTVVAIGVVVALGMGGIKAWDELVTKPQAAAKAERECAAYIKAHPAFQRPAKNASAYTFEQFTGPCLPS